jgi:hypothetical protein
MIGGDGYVVNVEESIGGRPSYSRYSNNYRPVFNGALLQNGGDPLVYDLIKETKVTQFDAIKRVSHLISNLSTKDLTTIISNIFLKHLADTNTKKFKQLGGYVVNFENILTPLGTNNLVVLASLLLLHHFATQPKTTIISGGNSLKDIMKTLKDAFHSKKMTGGNPLKDLIAPLGTSAFVATGLLIVLQKMFTSKINEKVLVGGKKNKHYDLLISILAPITFNTFATKSFLDKMIPILKK